MPEIVNLTIDEWRGWKRAKEYGELSPGYTGWWVKEALGEDVWQSTQRRAYFVAREDAERIPSKKYPRVERISQKLFDALLAGEDEETADD